MRKLKFIWIDDESGRATDSETMKKDLDIGMAFHDLRNRDISVELPKILAKSKPDLVLIDHLLDKVKKSIIKHGSSAAEIIKEKWIDCPIICITAAAPVDVDLHKRKTYEELIEHSDFSQYYTTLVSIAKSFNILREKRPKNASSLVKLLKSPAVDNDRIESILPEEIKINLGDPSLYRQISKWVRGILIERPGFLYDSLWAATFLGLNEKGFKKVEPMFSKAKYNGLFADEKTKRWWSSSLNEIVYSRPNAESPSASWKMGRSLPNIKKSDFSRCYVCENEFPETVAYTDESADARYAMHLRCTTSHPKYSKALFFEEIRMMNPAP
jgi:hypothetical protein